ncbi:MAG TPA: fibronectin type III domain-containing protein [Steroidobacteraceae bacterium]
MKTASGNMFRCALAGVALVAATTVAAAQPGRKTESKRIPLSAATMIIEFNASAEDIGVQFFLDSEGWKEIEIFDPSGQEIFGAETEGRLTRQGGGTELFLESVEPPTDELSIEKFFRRFPQGTYKFQGRDNDGNRLTGHAEFTHDIPAGPEVVMPQPAAGAECAVNVPASGAVIAWNPVTKSIFGDPLNIVGYEVIVENDDVNFDVKFPAQTGTMLTVSMELLQPGTDYMGEVLAVEESGNQTIAEFCFSTAP